MYIYWFEVKHFFFPFCRWRGYYHPEKEGWVDEFRSELGEVWKRIWRLSRWVIKLWGAMCTSHDQCIRPVISRAWVCVYNFHTEPYWFVCVTGEFWLGLRKIHSLASQGDTFLNIQLEDWKQGKRFIEYNFSLDGPEAQYTIHLSQASGNLPDAMSNRTGTKFSTKDRDNDNLEDSHCAYTYTGTVVGTGEDDILWMHGLP